MPTNDGKTTTNDLLRRTHSWRNYDPEEFVEAARVDGKVNARQELKAVEGGRFYPFLKAGHKFFRALDPDEMQSWANQNPEMMKWIGVYGYLEDLITWPQYTGIEQEL